MFREALGIKLINVYILKLFIIRFFVILLFALFSGFLIEFSSKLGNFNAFSFFLNFQSIFSFVFFISSAWTILTLHKTREFIILQASTVNIFKIFFLFLLFALFWGIFFLTVYEGLILKKMSQKASNYNFLDKIEIYNKSEDPCNYSLFIFEGIGAKEDQAFSFKNADVFSFVNCKFGHHFTLLNGRIKKSENFIVISDANMKFETNYSYNVFNAYFEEKLDNQRYKTFFEKLILIKSFKKFQIDYRLLEFSVMNTIKEIISFFYTIAIAFLFFAKVPPRGKILFRLFSSICFIACVYMVNIIISGYTAKSLLLNPVFTIIPSIILFFIVILILIFRKA